MIDGHSLPEARTVKRTKFQKYPLPKLGPPSHDAAEIALLFLMMNARVTDSTMTYLVELGGVVRN